jgi:hypothetical protein
MHIQADPIIHYSLCVVILNIASQGNSFYNEAFYLTE